MVASVRHCPEGRGQTNSSRAASEEDALWMKEAVQMEVYPGSSHIRDLEVERRNLGGGILILEVEQWSVHSIPEQSPAMSSVVVLEPLRDQSHLLISSQGVC